MGPVDMTQGGFETGSDYVAARVSFEVNDEGATSLKELTEQLKNFRTATEAANRTGTDFIKYLQTMTQLTNQATEAQKALVDQLNKLADVQQSLMTGQGTQVTRGLPQGRVDPQSGMGGGAGTGASRAPTIGDASSYLGQMAKTDPRQYFNMQQNWGNVRTGDVPAASPSDNDLAQHAQRHHAREQALQDQNASHMKDPFSPIQRRINGMTSGASQLINEMGGGGSEEGMLGLAQKGMMSLSGMLRGSGAAAAATADGAATVGTVAQGGLGAFLARGAGMGLGAAGLGLGAAAAGMGLYQMGGAAVQDVRQLGQSRGGGFQEGMGYEMAIRSMALNPFLSTDQARQIVSSGLSSGYTGKEFDTVTQFMANNLKDMNMQVADSMKLFKKNVGEGGMSQEGLSSQLEALKIASKHGFSSLEELTGSYANASGAMISAGVAGPQASKQAAAASLMFDNVQDLKEVGAKMAASANMKGSMMPSLLRNASLSGVNVPNNVSMGGTMEWIGDNADGNQAIFNVVRKQAQLYQRSGMSKSQVIDSMQSWLIQAFPDMPQWQDRTIVSKFVTEALANPNAVREANAANEKAQAETRDVKGRGGWEQVGGTLAGGFQTVFQGVGELFGNVMQHGGTLSDWKWDKTKQANTDALIGGMSTHSQAFDSVLRQYGATGGLEINVGGKWQKMDLDEANQSQERAWVEAASKGAKIRQTGKGGDGLSLTELQTKGFDTTGGGGRNAFSLANSNVNVGGVLRITIDRDGRITSIPNQVDLNQNQIGANEGAGNMTHNSPGPGQGNGYR